MQARAGLPLTAGALAIALVATACSPTANPTTTEPITTTTQATTTTTEVATTTTTPATPPQPAPSGLRAVVAFTDGYEAIPLLVDEPAYRGPGTPASLDEVLWLDEVEGWEQQYPGMLDRLAANGFVILGRGDTQFHQQYGAVEDYRRQPLFVTTDAAYHYWHLVFAKALKDTERSVLLPLLEQFAGRLLELAQHQEATLAATSMAGAATAVTAYAEVAAALTGDAEISYSQGVADELDRISLHTERIVSPVTGAYVDYSLFVPRGHYTTSEELKTYFLGMSALGTTAYVVHDDEQLLRALLLSRLIVEDASLSGLWRDLYEPTAFLVGLADDYSPFELADAVETAGIEWDDPGSFNEAALDAIRMSLADLRPVEIDPERASVRVMGARFVLDSLILDQLVLPYIDRTMGTPLDVAAAFGSEWALERLEDLGATELPGYRSQLAEMQDLVARRGASEWAGTVYDAWLYAIQPSWIRHGAAFPDFMQTEAWDAKSHQSGFGTYTELKHDTVLYSKQGFAEGEGPPPPPAEPRHWVEPEPVAFARLAAMASLMRDGLDDRGLLDGDVAALLDMLSAMYDRFERLARDELAGRSISGDDNLWLEGIGATFELIWLLANEDDTSFAGESGFSEAPYDMSGLVVDIMANPEEALEIATGMVDRILVLVPNDDGVFQVARGGAYSYYEFLVPVSERMTDEQWRQLFVDEWGGTPSGGPEPPDRPTWIAPILVEPSG